MQTFLRCGQAGTDRLNLSVDHGQAFTDFVFLSVSLSDLLTGSSNKGRSGALFGGCPGQPALQIFPFFPVCAQGFREQLPILLAGRQFGTGADKVFQPLPQQCQFGAEFLP